MSLKLVKIEVCIDVDIRYDIWRGWMGRRELTSFARLDTILGYHFLWLSVPNDAAVLV